MAKNKQKTRKPLTQDQRDRKNAHDREVRAAKKLALAKPPRVKKPKVKYQPKLNKVVRTTFPVKIPGLKKKIPVALGKLTQNSINRPKPFTSDGKPKLTFRVWQIADEISARNRVIATRQEVLDACNNEEIKYSTFSNEFYRWRKFNGKFGRIRKDGVAAAVTGGPQPKKIKPINERISLPPFAVAAVV